jgi:hypothetical protein
MNNICFFVVAVLAVVIYSFGLLASMNSVSSGAKRMR